MIHNRNQNTQFRSRTDCFNCIIVEEIKIFCNLVNYYIQKTKIIIIIVGALSPAGIFIDSKKQCVVLFRFVG